MRKAELIRKLLDAGFEKVEGSRHDLYRKGEFQVPMSRGSKSAGHNLIRQTLVTIKRAAKETVEA